MPSPQIVTAFQPRTLEIAACKGFQIIDYRKDLNHFFSKDEIVTFSDINNLKEKITYFINNPDERKSYINKLYNVVVNNHSWDIRIKEYLDIISKVKKRFNIPIFAYQVSGEFSILKLAEKEKTIDYKKCLYESLVSIKRAGASGIFCYGAIDIAKNINHE